MKTKTLVVLLVILAISAGAGLFLFRSPDVPVSNGAMGTLIFETLPANEITSIVIDRPDGSVILVKEKDIWIVENRFGYPADFSRITDLIRKVKQTKAGRKFSAAGPVTKRLSLISPSDKKAAQDEKATRIRFMKKDKTVAADILLGNTRKRKGKGIPDSQYVMLADGTDIYLVDQIFSSFETSAPKWLKKSPVNAAKEDIRKIICVGPDNKPRYTFERPAKGKEFVLINPPTQRKIKQSDLNRLSGALAGLAIEDVANPSDPPESLSNGISPRISYTLFNGITYHVFPGVACSPGIPCYLRLQVAFSGRTTQKETQDPGKASGKKDAADGETDASLTVKAKELNDRLGPWAFVIPEWQHQAFFTTLNEMLEKEKEK